MGATNALAAYRRWAGRVPATSMILLTYMSLVSKDKDDWPWYGQGQEALAEFALGRENPDRADLRAVSRAMQPLLDAGAVTVDRAAAARNEGNSTARYRLNITDRADGERRKWEETHDGKRRTSTPVGDPQRTTESGHDVRRFSTQRTTESGTTYDGNRRTKEEEDQEEQEDQGISGSSTTASHPSRAHAPDEPLPENVIPIERPPPRQGRLATENLAGAAARVAARKAAHQARLAAGGEP